MPLSRLRYTWRPQTVISDTEFYGLGWRSLFHKSQRIISHGGLIKGVRHLLYMVPDADFGIFVLTNLTHNEVPHKICEYATDLLMGLPLGEYDFKARGIYLKEVKSNCPPLVQEVTYQAAAYTGHYSNPILGKALVVDEGDELKLYLGNKPAIALLQPIGANQFRLYFTGDSGADIGEGHWGTATFLQGKMHLKAHQRFDGEEFDFDLV